MLLHLLLLLFPILQTRFSLFFLGFSHGWVSHSFIVGGILTTTKKKCEEKNMIAYLSLFWVLASQWIRWWWRVGEKRERIGEFLKEKKCIISNSKKEKPTTPFPLSMITKLCMQASMMHAINGGDDKKSN